MDTAARAQVRLILNDLVIRTQKAAEARITNVQLHAYSIDRLRSGTMVKESVKAIEEIVSEHITTCVDQVATVAKDIEAFAMVQESFEALLRSMGEKADDIIRRATGGDPENSPEIASAGAKFWMDSKESLIRQLEIHRFSFIVPYSVTAKNITSQPAAPKNRGGKPLAAHWNEMWAAIAVSLYSGDLKPKSQADIERSMMDWFVDQSISVSDSAVRERAQALWSKLRDAE